MPPSTTETVDLGLVDGLAQLAFAVHGALGRIATANDVSIVQVRLLGILRDRRPTIGQLADFLELDKSSVTGLVDRAAERGLVERAPSDVDGRSVHVAITPHGRRIVARAVREFERTVDQLAIDLTESQRARLSAAASTIVAADARRRSGGATR